LILLYHVFFILGYIGYLHSNFFKNKLIRLSNGNSDSPQIENYVLKYYWIFLALYFISALISHRNITHSSSYIPWTFFSDFYTGLLNPAAARNYYASSEYSSDFVGNKYVTALLFFIGVFKYCLLPVFIYLWDRLSPVKKFVGAIFLLIPIISGVTLSLSSINFHYLFVMFICFLYLLVSTKRELLPSVFKKRITLLIIFLLLFLFSFWQFYSVKSGASLYQVVVNNQKAASFDYMKMFKLKFKSDTDVNGAAHPKSILTDYSEKITVYLVQGYLGMSISLSEKFESSFGIGHSIFLQRVFDKHLGIHISDRSFQHKINDQWSENEQWHSAYSHFANDVSFPGVCFVMLLLGFYFSMVVSAAVVSNDFIAKLLLPLFGIMFFYFPANNQVLGFLETMSSFWILTLFFLFYSFFRKSKST
jgi:hypothetical protein